ncbi:hypothetical protein F383_01188 [Gossypium arboreum]|uniref:Uncharacterized protein n=1 Tax=Gossypium arboreum TaxID=29729 RepID=A0A0B0PGN9_GOSAR|nr:hypothetical protein F383_01188 [Gossypium arboreum]
MVAGGSDDRRLLNQKLSLEHLQPKNSLLTSVNPLPPLHEHQSFPRARQTGNDTRRSS